MPPAVNNLQTLFEFAKAASGSSHGKVRLKDLRSSWLFLLACEIADVVSYSYQNTCCWLWHWQGVSGRTLEELENQILPGTKGHAMTAEDLERQLRGEGSKPPPLPEPHLQHPPPGFLPGSPGPRNQTPQVRKENVPVSVLFPMGSPIKKKIPLWSTLYMYYFQMFMLNLPWSQCH